MSDFSGYSVGDDISFEYELSSIAKQVSRHGEVSEVTVVPDVGDVLFVEVEMPTRLIEYELRLDVDDDQVVKRLAEDGTELGTFGPIVG